MNKNASVYDKTQPSMSQIDQIQNYQAFSRDQQVKSQNKQLDQQPSKVAKQVTMPMQRFCYEFCKDHYDKTDFIINLNDLVKKYFVQKRRVYELLGILEGFNFINKINKKSTYLWMGTEVPHTQFHFQQNKPVSLKDIASLLKLLLKNCRAGLTMKQLNEKILTKIQQKTKQNKNKTTIIRRIYECLNVLRILGMIEKGFNANKLTIYRLKASTFEEFRNSIQTKENQKKQQSRNTAKKVEKSQNIIVRKG